MKLSLAVDPIIRQATKDDIPPLTNLLELLFSIEVDFSSDGEAQKKGLELLLEQNNAAVFVAEYNGAIIGMATVQLVISTAEGGFSMLIEDVVVAPEYRNQKIGSNLLENIGQWGLQRGAVRMQLLADKTNGDGLLFYNAQNWQETKLICFRKYYRK